MSPHGRDNLDYGADSPSSDPARGGRSRSIDPWSAADDEWPDELEPAADDEADRGRAARSFDLPRSHRDADDLALADWPVGTRDFDPHALDELSLDELGLDLPVEPRMVDGRGVNGRQHGGRPAVHRPAGDRWPDDDAPTRRARAGATRPRPAADPVWPEEELADVQGPADGWPTAADELAEDELAEDRRPWGVAPAAEVRRESLVSHGRTSARRLRLTLKQKVAAGAAAGGALITLLIIALAGGSASWPSSVATVQAEAVRACRNPDVQAEPTQVNFACAKSSRQILWVFALLTSGGDPAFRDPSTGRQGLEPITPAQGGEVAWSLNLHRPYNPADPVDSLEVAARAINNIIGGATLTGSTGKPVVQSGLESSPRNCVRYTGSARLTKRTGFPSVCAAPVTLTGQQALVADVFSKWIVGAAPRTASNAAVLFANADDPGSTQVQAILRGLQHPRRAA
jgi:hypothetical protein